MAEVDPPYSESKLPVDLLHLLCTELAARLDFATLFSCAVSSKRFSDAGALANLYRISHLAPVKSGNESLPQAEQEQLIQKWSIMWRTTILSCFDETMYPYVRYLRVLDLRDLFYLLDDDKFRGKIYANFFIGRLDQFDFLAQIRNTRAPKYRARIASLHKNVTAIGSKIVEGAHMLEELTEPSMGEYNILSGALPQWAPSLGRLQSIELWDGKPLGNENIRNLLHTHCPSLRRIRVYQWREDDSDEKLAKFIVGMPANTLTEFENHGECGIGPETCSAFNKHSNSLKILRLDLPDKGIPGLGRMQSCTNIEVLKLTDSRPPHNLKTAQNDVYLDVINWLKECKDLRDVSLLDFVSAPDVLTEVLNTSQIQLEELQVSARDDCMYLLKDHNDFHLAIGRQRKLRSLLLQADPEPLSPEARDLLVEQLCQLTELRYLKLTRSSDYFQDRHVQMLAENLLNLEDLLVAGWQIGDPSLEKLSNLGDLKTITFQGPTNFTAVGLLDFINELGPGNQGLNISVDMAITEGALANEEKDIISEALMKKVQGRFEYQLIRDPDLDEYYDSGSD